MSISTRTLSGTAIDPLYPDPRTERRLMTDRELEKSADEANRRAAALEAELRRLRGPFGQSTT